MAVAVRDHGSAGDRHASPGMCAVLGVLDVLDRQGASGLAELAAATGLPKSTLHRACAAMEERGFVRRSGVSGYTLGPRAIELGARSPGSALASAFEAEATDLLARHNETVCLVVLDGPEALFIAKVETTQAVRLVTRVGSRLPAFASAGGRALLAALPSATVDGLLAGVELVTPVGRRLDGMREVHAILDRVRARGYAESVDETTLGLRCLAVPLAGPQGTTVAAMTLCIPAGRVDDSRRARLLADLRVSGVRVSAALRAIGQPPGVA